MLLARIATKKAKPNGVYYIRDNDFMDLLAELEVKELPGVGPATVDRLKKRGITQVRQLRELSKEALQSEFGKKHGEMIYQYARGVDERVIAVQTHTRKSVGTQISWGVRFQEMAQLERFLYDVATEVQRRMREIGTKGKRINLRIKKRAEDAPEPTKLFNPGKHTIIHKSVTLAQATDDADVIARECLKMYKQSRIALVDFRGVGLSIDQLEGQQTKKSKRMRTLDDMLKMKPAATGALAQPQPPPAAAAAAEASSSSSSSMVQEERRRATSDESEQVEGVLVQEESDMFSFGRCATTSSSSDSPPTMTVSPEEAAREAELLRDRQPSPDLWSFSPPSPMRPTETDLQSQQSQVVVVHSSGSSSGGGGAASASAAAHPTSDLLDLDRREDDAVSTQFSSATQHSSSTPEAMRNVVIASEQPADLPEVLDLTQLSSSSSSSLRSQPAVVAPTTKPSSMPLMPPPLPPAASNSNNTIALSLMQQRPRKKASAAPASIPLASELTGIGRGRGRGRGTQQTASEQQQPGAGAGAGAGARFKQLELGLFAARRGKK